MHRGQLPQVVPRADNLLVIEEDFPDHRRHFQPKRHTFREDQFAPLPRLVLLLQFRCLCKLLVQMERQRPRFGVWREKFYKSREVVQSLALSGTRGGVSQRTQLCSYFRLRFLDAVGRLVTAPKLEGLVIVAGVFVDLAVAILDLARPRREDQPVAVRILEHLRESQYAGFACLGRGVIHEKLRRG